MKKLQVKIDFTGFHDAELDALSQTIIGKMSGNQHFPDLGDDVLLVQAAHVAYAQALAAAPRSGSLAKAVKDEARGTLRSLLHDMGIKINLAAKGNETMLESTGYPLVGGGRSNKAAARSNGLLDKPEDIKFRILPGTGCLKARVAKVDGASAYCWQYTSFPVTAESVWITVQTSLNNFMFSGLTIGGRYAFKVAGIGNNPALVFSDVASSFVI